MTSATRKTIEDVVSCVLRGLTNPADIENVRDALLFALEKSKGSLHRFEEDCMEMTEEIISCVKVLSKDWLNPDPNIGK